MKKDKKIYLNILSKRFLKAYTSLVSTRAMFFALIIGLVEVASYDTFRQNKILGTIIIIAFNLPLMVYLGLKYLILVEKIRKVGEYLNNNIDKESDKINDDIIKTFGI